jgi:hypothetical protein
MAGNANAEAAGLGAAAIALRQEIVANNSRTTAPEQAAVVIPSLVDARARLLALLRQRPAPKVETDAQAMARWARSGRRADAQRTLALVGSHVDRALARALLVSPKTVARWRHGTHAPTPRHLRQLLAVRAVLIYGGRR